MREYAKVGPKFWIGKTGKLLRAAGMETQVVAMYLLTSPHANMLGLYYCPVTFIAHETGLGLEGAWKGLRGASEAGFCRYDEASEVVWVIEMASYQIEKGLNPRDNRIAGVQKEYNALPENPFLTEFYDKYHAAFLMQSCREPASPLQAPSKGLGKPLRSQEQEQEQEQEQKQEQEQRLTLVRPVGRTHPTQASESFDRFWSAYPRKQKKQDAMKAFAKVAPPPDLLDDMLAAIEVWKQSAEWTREGGQFIPLPTSWLNGKRWQDATPQTAYSEAELRVIHDYNTAVAGSKWPTAETAPYNPTRAGAIRAFLSFNDKPDWCRLYFDYVAKHVPAAETTGFDWLLRSETYLRIREGVHRGVAGVAA